MQFRLAKPSEFPQLKEMIIDSFEPITWFKKLDEKYGPLNGQDWRQRWSHRMDKILATQIIIVGEVDGEIVAAATGTIDTHSKLGFIEILGVDTRHQGKGYGRQMLRGMLAHLRYLGMEQASLECLTDNDRGNALYASEGWDKVASSHRWFLKLHR